MESHKSYLLKNAKILVAEGFIDSSLLVKDGKVFINPDEDRVDPDKIIDARNCHIIPSFVDMHVHLREPGFSYKETIKSGSTAAAAGGFTTVCTMPNLNPAPDSLSHLRQQLDIIEKDAMIQVIPFATITQGRKGQGLVNYKELAPFVAGFSDDGSGVQSEGIMKEAMKEIAKTGKILSAHCEVESLLGGGYIHKGKYAEKHGHLGISSESEWKEVERNIRLVEETGCRLHVDHISTKETVELIREAKKKSLPVTCETGPHYLTFSDENLLEHGRFKMNPPIRSIEDMMALREGLIDGTIDVIATDHAPHSIEEKSKGLEKSAMGVVGLETAFSAVYTTMVSSGLMPFERLLDAMTIRPRQILGLSPLPFLREGADANFTVINLKENFIVDPKEFKTMGRATPYEGMNLQGKIKMTFYKGVPVYNTL